MAEYFEDFKLKVFLAVSRLGSFTLAARELGVSQPAVSQNITSLEKRLGMQLLERRRGDIFLTDAGRSFLRYAEQINYWYDAADRMFGEHGLATTGRPIKIAADAVCADYILPKALTTLSATHPELSFEVITSGSDADAVLTVSPSPKTMDFEGEHLLVGIMDAIMVASPVNRSMIKAAAASDNDRLPFSTIAGVHVSNHFAVWEGYRDFLSPDLLARVCTFSSSAELIKKLVCESDHIVGLLPDPSVADEVREGLLLRLPVRLPELAFDIHFKPTPEFAGRTACSLLKSAL